MNIFFHSPFTVIQECKLYIFNTFAEANSFLKFGMLCDFLYDGSFCEGLLGDRAVL